MSPRNIIAEIPDHHSDASPVEAEVEPMITEATHSQKRPPMNIVWRNVILFTLLHLSALYSLTLIPRAHPFTLLWSAILYVCGCVGITAGAHRLWTHRSFKAKLPLRIFLACLQSMSFQNHIYEWARDHRAHHKNSETDADPHSAKRGFFFAHMGWLCVKKHPDVIAMGRLLDLSDLCNDPVVMFQKRFYAPSIIVCWLLVPTVLPWFLWGENLWHSFYLATVLRYTFVLHATWLVNSAAHMWGMRPYDANINPSDNITVTISACGEGFHNYHHVFPHDYATSEYGWRFNITTMFIDAMAYLGQVYDRRKIPQEVIDKRKQRTGDGSK